MLAEIETRVDNAFTRTEPLQASPFQLWQQEDPGRVKAKEAAQENQHEDMTDRVYFLYRDRLLYCRWQS